MTISLIQQNSSSFAGSSLSFRSGVTRGSTLFLVPILYASGAVLTSSGAELAGETVPGTSLVQSLSNSGGGASAYHAIWMMPSVPESLAGQTAMSFTPGSGANVQGMFIYEVAGLGANPQAAGQSSGGNPGGTATASSGAAAVSGFPLFALGAAATYAGATSGPSQPYWSAADNGTGNGWSGYDIPSSPVSSIAWTQPTVSSADAWTAGVAAFAPQAPVPAGALLAGFP
jgi:hypothetical protein